jgi:hypothetical protein
VNTGGATQRVAPATLNCTSSRSAGRSQARRQPARSRARTLDGELARRLSTKYSDTQLNYQPRGLNCLSDEVPPFTHYVHENSVDIWSLLEQRDSVLAIL